MVKCGTPATARSPLQWDFGTCGTPLTCLQRSPGSRRRTVVAAFATLVRQNGHWVLQTVWCPASAQPAPNLAALRDQALRLLPTVAVGTAWDHRGLVNAEAVLWAATARARRLPTVTVVGQRVALRIGFDHADWDYGDGQRETTADPGRVYRESDPCHTAQCDGYAGHTYRTSGPMTITLQVSWHAQFSLDGGATWTDIDPAPLTGPATVHALTIEQARAVLVPDPRH